MIQFELRQQLITEARCFGDFFELYLEGFWLVGLGCFFNLLDKCFLIDVGQVGAVVGIAEFDEFFIESFIET